MSRRVVGVPVLGQPPRRGSGTKGKVISFRTLVALAGENRNPGQAVERTEQHRERLPRRSPPPGRPRWRRAGHPAEHDRPAAAPRERLQTCSVGPIRAIMRLAS